MSTRIVQSAIVMCLFLGSLAAATDPFVGKWKLDQPKSKMTGEQVKIAEPRREQVHYHLRRDL